MNAFGVLVTSIQEFQKIQASFSSPQEEEKLKEKKKGCGLFILGSFFNHGSVKKGEVNCSREMWYRMMIVTAGKKIKKGEEIVTFYGLDDENVKSQWDIE